MTTPETQQVSGRQEETKPSAPAGASGQTQFTRGVSVTLLLSSLALAVAMGIFGLDIYQRVFRDKQPFFSIVPLLDALFIVLIVVHLIGLPRRRAWAYELGLYINVVAVFVWGFRLWTKLGMWRYRLPIAVHVFAFLFLLASRKAFSLRQPEPGEDGKRGPDESLSFSQWLLDNVEAILLAFIAALVIRCFCLEVFKIPTGSMIPTLIGHQDYGDRIMVNKFALHFENPKRFDVIVFKYPLDTARNFIKRLVGMPNEDLMFSKGDVFYRPAGHDRFLLARKPFHVQQSIWIPHCILPAGGFQADEFLDSWAPTSEGAKWKIAKSGAMVLQPGTSFRLRKRIMDLHEVRHSGLNIPSSGGSNEVRDVKLAISFVLKDPQTVLRGELCNGAMTFAYSLGIREGKFSVEKHTRSGSEKRTFAFNSPVEATNSRHSVELMYFDGCVYLLVDGRQMASKSLVDTYEDRPEIVLHGAPAASFSVERGACEIIEIAVFRDIYYIAKGCFTEDEFVRIPPGKYVVIGDNSPTSKDSRLWKYKTLRLVDGRVVVCDEDNCTERQSLGQVVIRRDIYGVDHIIPMADIVPDETPSEYLRFIDEEDLVGRGFLVWWPPERMKLVK